MTYWKPREIIVHEMVKDDPVTHFFLKQCPGIPVKYVSNGNPKSIVKASEILTQPGRSLLDKILAGKQVVYIAPATDVVDVFTMPDDRMVCPHFDRLKLASNGCFYQGEWAECKILTSISAAHYTLYLCEAVDFRVDENKLPLVWHGDKFFAPSPPQASL